MKKTQFQFVIAAVLVVLLASLASCDFLKNYNPTLLGYPTVRGGPGEVGYGSTYNTQIAVGSLPHTENFFLKVEGGDGPVSIRSISDITDHDDASYHGGAMTISHANSTGSFEITSGADYGFQIVLDNTAASGNTYEILVAIQNNDGIMPNPYIFRFRVDVTP